MDFVIIMTFSSHYRMNIDGGGGIFMINMFFLKKFGRCFSYPSTPLIPLMLDL